MNIVRCCGHNSSKMLLMKYNEVTPKYIWFYVLLIFNLLFFNTSFPHLTDYSRHTLVHLKGWRSINYSVRCASKGMEFSGYTYLPIYSKEGNRRVLLMGYDLDGSQLVRTSSPFAKKINDVLFS